MVRPDANNVVFLAGSARSGTTWLSNLINFKNDYRYIFEPFWGEKVQMCRAFGTRQYLRSGTDDERYLGPARAIISGRVRNKWADQFNQNFDNRRKGVSTCLDHTLHVVVGPRTPSHELTVRHGIDLYGVLKQAVEQQSTRP